MYKTCTYTFSSRGVYSKSLTPLSFLDGYIQMAKKLANVGEMRCYSVIISNVDDLRFLKPMLPTYAASGAFAGISISVGNQTWDGSAEDASAVTELRALAGALTSPSCVVTLTTYDVPADIDVDKQARLGVCSAMYWEAHARELAVRDLWRAHGKDAVASSASYVLFLDSDEIVDVDKFKMFAREQDVQTMRGMKLCNYWYWREPTLRARSYYEDSAVLVRGDVIDGDCECLYSNAGRHAAFERAAALGGPVARSMRGVDGRPMVHHYSWVRSKGAMLKKVRAWGHRDDRSDWEALVHDEFSRPFNGTDFLKHLSYETVPNAFGIPADI